MRLLFGRIGKTISPVSGQVIKKQTVEDVLNTACSYDEGTRIALTVAITLPEGRNLHTHLEILMKQGYSRVFRDGQFLNIEDLISENKITDSDKLELLIDRLLVMHHGDESNRLA